MKCTVFYIANVAQLAGIFGMIYVQIQHKPAKISTKPRAAYIADKQRTITLHCASKAPEKLLCFIQQFPFFSPPFLKICSIKRALISISSAPESNRKAAPCANLLCFTAILIYIKICFMPKHQIWCWRTAAKEPAQSSLGTDLLDPLHRLRKPLTPVWLCCFG